MESDTCHVITDNLIPDYGIIVFDWDNTLKVYDHHSRQISSRVTKGQLEKWKLDKQCNMFIISAIRPSRMNMETLLFEVDKVGLTELFTTEGDKIELKAGQYARKGNIVICGYDKAETFLQIMKEMNQPGCGDEVDSGKPTESGKVVFFDDEEVNVINFRALVAGSKCYLIQ